MGVLIQDDLFDDDCSDYSLDDEAASVWISVGNLSVYIIRTDEGVVVDLFPRGNEGAEPIASTWALDDEGLPDVE